MRKIALLLPLLWSLIVVTGCQSAYYSTMEKVGVHKRDILADRVDKAQNAQQEAQQQFKSALDQFSTLIKFDGGNLQRQYELTDAEYQACNEAAAEVSERINSIADVAEALFDEWQDELEMYTNPKLKQDSKAKLNATQRQYKQLLSAMRRAESSMAPVLDSLLDNSLYLKHNLNAQAIGALRGEFANIERDITLLIQNMNKAISESQKFIATLKQ
jgi:F0F1-type ATP synthase membrane subunit b/b'